MVNIEMSRTVVEWMKDLAIRLFQEAYGSDWTPQNAIRANYRPGTGLVSQIPRDNMELFDWFGAVNSLLRTIAAILDYELERLAESPSDIESLTITFGDSAEI